MKTTPEQKEFLFVANQYFDNEATSINDFPPVQLTATELQDFADFYFSIRYQEMETYTIRKQQNLIYRLSFLLIVEGIIIFFLSLNQ